LPDDSEFCYICGERVETALLCSKCGSKLADDAEFCHKCGTKSIVDDDTQRKPEYSGIVVETSPALPILHEKPRRNKPPMFVLLPIAAVVVIVLVFVLIMSNNSPSTRSGSGPQSTQTNDSSSDRTSISGSTGNPGASSNPGATTDPNATSNHEREVGADPQGAGISVEEAYQILQEWLYSHPFSAPADIEDWYGYGEHVIDSVEYYVCYFGIERFCTVEVLVNKSNGEMLHFLSYGTDVIEPLDDWYYSNHAYGDVDDYPVGLSYRGIPVSVLLSYSRISMANALGRDFTIDSNHYQYTIFSYADIEFLFDEDYGAQGSVSRIFADPRALSIDGVTLNKNRNGIVALFGTPWYEEVERYDDGPNIATVMYSFADYYLVFKFFEPDPAYSVAIIAD